MVDIHHGAPGVYRQDVFPTPAPSFLSGVPVFLGRTADGPPGPPEPQLLTLWPQFEERFGPGLDDGYLADAVRGFFENDGLRCYVLRLEEAGSPADELRNGLEVLRGLEDVDLVCAPDIMRTGDPAIDPDPLAVAALQRAVLDHCDAQGDRFAVLDGAPTRVEQQRAALAGDSGALYHPWLWVPGQGPGGEARYVPPCGHVAGIYSRCDRAVGVHKAPANEVVEGASDLRADLGERDVGLLHAQGINCLRALPGRGLRVWGARTLSADPAWRHVNVRRVFLSLGRWIERFMAGLVHEPNDIRLWVRIMRDLTGYLDGLFQRGALKGRTADEAFFVKCDGETNPREVIDAGMVVTQVGLAPAAPAEFVVVRIIHGASGVSITTGS
jgi:phage tail sheath protein FI